jgi:hypothetical protein
METVTKRTLSPNIRKNTTNEQSNPEQMLRLKQILNFQKEAYPQKVTEPPTTPDDTEGVDAVGSVLVCTVTESVAALAAPIVQPTRVTVTAASAARVVPVTAKMMDVLPGGPGARLVPPVDTFAVGVGVVAKKPDG